jgi:hypothetical protein
MYKNSNRNGQGLFAWNDGRKYEGEWKEGAYHGVGTYVHKDGSRYEGEWKDNMRYGNGAFYWNDGDYYVGKWVDGKRNGEGQLHTRNETGEFTVIDQVWQEDKFHKHNKGNQILNDNKKKRKLPADSATTQHAVINNPTTVPTQDETNNTNLVATASEPTNSNSNSNNDNTNNINEEGVASTELEDSDNHKIQPKKRKTDKK